MRTDNVTGEILKVSLPMMIGQFMMTISGFISALILSYVSTEVFAASMLISSLQLVISLVPFAMFFCIGPIVSQIVSAKQNVDQVGVIFRSSLLIGFYIAIGLMFVLWFVRPILLMTGQLSSLIDITESYFHAFLWALPAIVFMRVGMQILNGLFKQQVVLLFSFCSVTISSILGYLMVFGIWGLPKLGVAGLGWAFVIQAYVLDVAMLIYFVLNKSFESYSLFGLNTYAVIKETQKKLMQIGGPIVLQTGNELFSFFITTLMVGWLGSTALMAKQITVRYLLLLVIPLFALGQSASVFVGKYFGANELHKAKKYTQIIMNMGLIYTISVTVVFWFAPEPFINIFMTGKMESAQFIKLVSWLLIIVSVGQIFDAVKNIATGALRGLGDTKYAMQISLIFVWPVGLGMSYIFGFTFHWGLIGMAIAHLLAAIASSALIYGRWMRLADKHSSSKIT